MPGTAEPAGTFARMPPRTGPIQTLVSRSGRLLRAQRRVSPRAARARVPGAHAELTGRPPRRLLSRESPSGALKAVLRKARSKEDEKQFLEVWDQNRKVKSIDLTALDKHGSVYDDDQFGCLAWSHSETHLLYVAEKKRPKAESFFQSKAPELGGSAEEDLGCPKKPEAPVKGEQFVYREGWGETLGNRSVPVLCVLDIEGSSISVLEGIPEHVSPGQAFWSPGDTGVVFAGVAGATRAVAPCPTVNYRGSLGFGQDSVDSLLGNVGTQDVQDVQLCVEQVLQEEALDSTRVALMGGSHGGFLACHLIGQFPDTYQACVVRNPVVNIASMVTTTDIPDWCLTETGLPYAPNAMPAPGQWRPFACLAWSHAETRLLYVAEKSQAEPRPLFSGAAPGAAGPVVEEEEEKFVYREDWGEALSGRSVPVL
ncbi:PREDICTED: acylamino-acid-releasing enzyme, partial [Tinamus guttatus]|uniref:acylamino-acid-releasing enzyme n=1 Tax=Tinamus guttatus TaxID=94827 RepID=UPI00052E9ECA